MISILISISFFLIGFWISNIFDFTKGKQHDNKFAISKDLDTIIPIISNRDKSNVQYKSDTIFEDDIDLILKDADEAIIILRKFRPKRTFKDFPVLQKYGGGQPKQLDFSSCKYGKLYKTASKVAAEREPNFAGHYVFTSLGCGTNCQVCILVDLQSGRVYAGPESTGGYDFRLNSRILIVNPPDSSGHYCPQSAVYNKPEQYLWTTESFKQLDNEND